VFACASHTKQFPSETTETASKAASAIHTEMRNCVLPAFLTAAKLFGLKRKGEHYILPSGTQMDDFVRFFSTHLLDVATERQGWTK
jgi:hypothetical protein